MSSNKIQTTEIENIQKDLNFLKKKTNFVNDDNIKELFDAKNDFVKIINNIDERLHKLDGAPTSYYKVDSFRQNKKNKISGGRRTRGKKRGRYKRKSRRRKRRKKNRKKRTKRRK